MLIKINLKLIFTMSRMSSLSYLWMLRQINNSWIRCVFAHFLEEQILLVSFQKYI